MRRATSWPPHLAADSSYTTVSADWLGSQQKPFICAVSMRRRVVTASMRRRVVTASTWRGEQVRGWSPAKRLSSCAVRSYDFEHTYAGRAWGDVAERRASAATARTRSAARNGQIPPVLQACADHDRRPRPVRNSAGLAQGWRRG